MSVDDGPGDTEGVAEIADTVGAHLEAPRRGVAPLRPAVPGEVEIDDLRDLGEPREIGLEVRVVEAARAAVQEDDRRPLVHASTSGHERWAVDVEPQPRPVDVDDHRTRLLRPTSVPRASRRARGLPSSRGPGD